MKESYSEDLTSHASPESCASARKNRCEALMGGSAGELLSHEIRPRGTRVKLGGKCQCRLEKIHL